MQHDHSTNSISPFVEVSPVYLSENVELQVIDEDDYAVRELQVRRDRKLNSEVHATASSRLVEPEDSPFIWLGSYKKSSPICASSEYASLAQPVQSDEEALTAVVQALHTAYLNNFPPALLALGELLLNVHFEHLLSVMR